MAAMLAEWDRCRWVWNRAVERLNETGEWVRDTTLTAWRGEHDWLGEGSVVAQQQMLRNFRAKRAKGKGRRKFKSAKRCLPSLNYTKRGFTVKDGRLCLAGGLCVPVVWSRELPAEPSSVRSYRDSIGHWYASFVVRRDGAVLPACDQAIGIDWGVRAVATTTDPDYDLAHPKHAKRAAQGLAHAQRTMARRKPAPGQRASKGYLSAKRVAAKLSKKVARQRQDTARKWATKVVAAHGILAVEDFKPKFLAKSRMLLSQRVFVCESCGAICDRDRNAARVILARAGLNPAGVEAVRHSDLLEVRVLAEPGIPAP